MNFENQPTRVRFQERQILRTGDLIDDQAYHLEMRRRHNLALHSWGIAYGLELEADGNDVFVLPGMAIDGYGRELVLAQKAKVNVDRSVSFDVWLQYGWSEEVGRHSDDARRSKRFMEKPNVSLLPTSKRPSLNTREPDVPRGDLNFSPDRPPPDDPARAWPVFLGKIQWQTAAEPDALPLGKWEIDLADRPYAGLIAEQIRSPVAEQGQSVTLIQNGSDPNYREFPFAVYVNDSAQNVGDVPPVLGISRERVAIHSSRVTLDGDLVLGQGAALEFEPNPIPPKEAKETANAGDLPWRMYHYFAPAELSSKEPSAGPKPPSANTDGLANELRIAMAGSPAHSNSVVIGHWSDKGKFVPVLTIGADGNVRIDGNLIVTGGTEGDVQGRKIQAPLTNVTTGGVSASPTAIPVDPLKIIAEYVGNGNSTVREGNQRNVLDKVIEATGGPKNAAKMLLDDRFDKFESGVKPAKVEAKVAELAESAASDETITRFVAEPALRKKLAAELIKEAVEEIVQQITEKPSSRKKIRDKLLTDDLAETVDDCTGTAALRKTFGDKLWAMAAEELGGQLLPAQVENFVDGLSNDSRKELTKVLLSKDPDGFVNPLLEGFKEKLPPNETFQFADIDSDAPVVKFITKLNDAGLKKVKRAFSVNMWTPTAPAAGS